MSIRNCPICGKIFVYVHRNLCPDCLAKEEEDFKRVKDYLYQHPGASLIQVSQDTGISEDKILQFIREGRVITDANVSITIECENCGAPITAGRFCDKCSNKLTEEFKARITPARQQAQGSLANQKSKRIHIMDRLKDK